jgi:hypothetical protein
MSKDMKCVWAHRCGPFYAGRMDATDKGWSTKKDGPLRRFALTKLTHDTGVGVGLIWGKRMYCFYVQLQ